MSAYGDLAPVYDRLTADVDYGAWADYVERHFRRQKRPVHTVLDLACGTGTMSCILAERGYELIGADASADMLAVAQEKAQTVAGIRPVFLQQSMEKLDLYGTVDACICLLDSVNYVTMPARLARAFHRVWLFLEPGGLFLFDADTIEKLRGLDGQVFLDEDDDVFCLWRGVWSERRRCCTLGMDLFQRRGEHWQRSWEEHTERAYEPEELETLLRQAGFVQIRRWGELKLRAPGEHEQRIFFTAHKPMR